MKIFPAALVSLALLAGCTLRQQLPQATIAFNPATHQIQITSGKDVVLSNVVANFGPTNTSLAIGYYRASYNVDVIREAVTAQKQQIDGAIAGGARIIEAAAKGL